MSGREFAALVAWVTFGTFLAAGLAFLLFPPAVPVPKFGGEPVGSAVRQATTPPTGVKLTDDPGVELDHP
ncbi:MAG: hypothetical protein JNM77_08820 [Pseudonocardia sp.]|nr:hypothetical protein [Pseudonocardia sp.]